MTLKNIHLTFIVLLILAGIASSQNAFSASAGASQDSVEFKVTTLNCDWLTCSGYGPSDEAQQVNNIATLIATMNPDLIALQEVGTSSSYTTIDTIVSRLGNSWAGNIIPSNNNNCGQNQGIIYKKSKVQFISSLLITNGGSSYYWSNGRYPALYNVNFVVGDTLIRVSVINIHAKAYYDATSYSRRKGASEGLKALLDGSGYNTKNIILLGDFNDYLRGTQCSSYSVSPYKNFIDDTANYEGLTGNLTDPYYSSPVIDNVVISNELFNDYVSNSAFRESSATGTISNYRYTTTDHTPVSVLFKMPVSSPSDTTQTSTSGTSLYPNPVSDYLYVKSESPVTKIEIYSLLGSKVLTGQLVADKIQMSALPGGVYMVRIYSKKDVITQKILKK